MGKNINQNHYMILSSHLKYHHYEALAHELSELTIWQTEQVVNYINLARAIMAVDVQKVEQLIAKSSLSIRVPNSALECKAYYYLQSMTLKLSRREFSDYLRGLTPLLVDLFRLAIEREFFPQLSEFIQPITKQTNNDRHLYRGLQWSQERIELDDNIIRQTWRKYYGSAFNYDHYISSSHLIKLIETHSTNDKLMTLATQMRRIEKYLRNLAAHEVIVVDEHYFMERVQLTSKDVHHILLALYDEIGLTDVTQRHLLEKIKQQLQLLLSEQIQLISKE